VNKKEKGAEMAAIGGLMVTRGVGWVVARGEESLRAGNISLPEVRVTPDVSQ
jgi:hypothetical protein